MLEDDVDLSLVTISEVEHPRPVVQPSVTLLAGGSSRSAEAPRRVEVGCSASMTMPTIRLDASSVGIPAAATTAYGPTGGSRVRAMVGLERSDEGA